MGSEMKMKAIETPLTRRYGAYNRIQQSSLSKAKAQPYGYNLRTREKVDNVHRRGRKSQVPRNINTEKPSVGAGRMPRRKSSPKNKSKLELSAPTSRRLPEQSSDKSEVSSQQTQNSTLKVS